MANEENINNENKSGEKCCGTSFWSWPGMFEAMAGCCGGMSKSGDSSKQ